MANYSAWVVASLLHRVCLLCLILTCWSSLNHKQDASKSQTAFFQSLDSNKDGQIEESEALQYIGTIGGKAFDTPQELKQAYNHMVKNLDTGDSGVDISSSELDTHLHSVLEGTRVADWIRHGVGLSQYAEAFKVNAITPLDFPLLIQDNGHLLASELGVTSALHQQKLMRAMQQQILGLGRPPGPIQAPVCAGMPAQGAIQASNSLPSLLTATRLLPLGNTISVTFCHFCERQLFF